MMYFFISSICISILKSKISLIRKGGNVVVMVVRGGANQIQILK